MSRAGEEKKKAMMLLDLICYTYGSLSLLQLSLWELSTPPKSKGDLNNDLLRFQFLITFNLKSEYRANIPVQECKCFTWVRSTDKIKRPQCFYVF